MTEPTPAIFPESGYRRGYWIEQALRSGRAVCPACSELHDQCGEEHSRRPWSITPRCRKCGEVLLMPGNVA